MINSPKKLSPEYTYAKVVVYNNIFITYDIF